MTVETEVLVTSAADERLDEGILVQLPDGREVGVFRLPDSRFVAYENRCAHQGGPVCSGVVLGRYEQVLTAEKTVVREQFSETDMHLVCPWHGWEFRLATGEAAANPRFRLQSFEVVERDGLLYLGGVR